MSRRKELAEYMESGRLRDDVSRALSEGAQDLLVDIVARYCEPRRKRQRGKPIAGLLVDRAAREGKTDG